MKLEVELSQFKVSLIQSHINFITALNHAHFMRNEVTQQSNRLFVLLINMKLRNY